MSGPRPPPMDRRRAVSSPPPCRGSAHTRRCGLIGGDTAAPYMVGRRCAVMKTQWVCAPAADGRRLLGGPFRPQSSVLTR